MIERRIAPTILESIDDTPLIFLSGARQVGKTTLLQAFLKRGTIDRYLTMDDTTTLLAAKENPEAFLAGLRGRVAIDEVQRVPELFLPLKKIIDEKRDQSHFLLTGSANALLFSEMSHYFVGRMEAFSIFPFSVSEFRERKFEFFDFLFKKDGLEKLLCQAFQFKTSDDLAHFLSCGGFPEIVKRSNSPKRQRAWFENYIKTLITRDVQDLSSISKIEDLFSLLQLLAARSSGLLNFAELARSLQMPQSSLKRYISLFQALHIVVTLPAWSKNLSKRVVKSPKLYFIDTGLSCHLMHQSSGSLLKDRSLYGHVLENFVALELIKRLSWSSLGFALYHYRTLSGLEVDFVVESIEGKILGIEVKVKDSISSKDYKALKEFAMQSGDSFHLGIVFYSGKEILQLGDRIVALPLSFLFGH